MTPVCDIANRGWVCALATALLAGVLLSSADVLADTFDLEEVWLEDLFRVYARSDERLDRGPFSDNPVPYRPSLLGHPETRALQRAIARKLNSKRRAGELEILRWYLRFLSGMSGNARRKAQLVEQVEQRIDSLTREKAEHLSLSDLWLEDLFKVYAGSSAALDRGPFGDAPQDYDADAFGNPSMESVASMIEKKLDLVREQGKDETLEWYLDYLDDLDGDAERISTLQSMVSARLDIPAVSSGDADQSSEDPDSPSLKACRDRLKREKYASMREHGIPPGWGPVFGRLKQASRRADHMWWSTWQQINDEPTEAEALFAEVIESTRDMLRDKAIEAAFGKAVAGRFGNVVMVVNKLYDLSKQWSWQGDGSNAHFEAREDYRRQQLYFFLLWQLANQLEADKGPFANPGQRYYRLGVLSKNYHEWANSEEWATIRKELCEDCPGLGLCGQPTIEPLGEVDVGNS